MKTLLQVAKLCIRESYEDILMPFSEDYYEENIMSQIQVLVSKYLLIPKEDGTYIITSELQEFVRNKGKTTEEIIEQDRILREQRTLELAEEAIKKSEEANRLSEISNNKSEKANKLSIVSIIISVISFILAIYFSK